MAPDWRKHKMDSAEGSGKARAAWDAVPGDAKKVMDRSAGVGPLGAVSIHLTETAFGFWLLWHIHGGFDGLRRFGMSRSAIYKNISRFRSAAGEHPDDFTLPGVTIDVAEYWRGAPEAEEKRKRLVEQYRQAPG